MVHINPHINIEEAKKVFWGNDNIEKGSYASMIGRTMHGIDDRAKDNLKEIMELLIDCVIIEKDVDAKEEMYMALLNMVILNDVKYVRDEVERLVTKLGLLKDKDLADALLVISETLDAKYIKLMQKYLTYPYEAVQDAAKEAIHDIKYAEKMKREKNK